MKKIYKEKLKDRNRKYLSKKDRLDISRKEKGEEKMGDLHLRDSGIVGRGSQSFRRSLKRQTNKLRRRSGREIISKFKS